MHQLPSGAGAPWSPEINRFTYPLAIRAWHPPVISLARRRRRCSCGMPPAPISATIPSSPAIQVKGFEIIHRVDYLLWFRRNHKEYLLWFRRYFIGADEKAWQLRYPPRGHQSHHRIQPCKSQFPHKFVNLSFVLVIVKDKLTCLCRN